MLCDIVKLANIPDKAGLYKEDDVLDKLAKNIYAKKNKKLDPNAKVRIYGDVVFLAESLKIKNNKDYFPINNKKQAKSALSYASHYKKSPGWHKGSLKELVSTVQCAVKRKYKSTEVTEKSAKPGEG